MLKEAYEAGARRAMIDAGLLKDAQETMDPMVQQSMQQRRTRSMAEGNRYAKGWYPNVPMSPTETAMATSKSLIGGVPKLPPIDYSAAASAPSPYTKQIGAQGSWTRGR